MKKRILTVLLTIAAVMIVGCSTQNTEEDSGEDVEASDSESASSEKVFRYAVNTGPTTLDPAKGLYVGDNEIQHAITEGLTRNVAGDVKPGIAESWDISDDGLTYTFHLRDAKWSDGVPIRAADYEYSWKRLVNPETESMYAFIGEYIKNGYAVEMGEMDPEELGIKAVDDKTLEVTLENPASYFLSLIGSSGQFAPVRQDVVEEYGADFAAAADKNVYSGPFKLTESGDNEYIFEKNENYWDVDAINLDRCELFYIEEADTQLSMYEAGDLDYVIVPASYVLDYGDKVDKFMNGNIDFLYINSQSENKVLQNKDFRLALNYAIDRNIYNELANTGTCEPLNRLVFPGLHAGGKTYGDIYEMNSYPLEGDQNQAKAHLKAAMKELHIASASDIELELTTPDTESDKKIAGVIREQWQKSLGIKVEIRCMTAGEIYKNVYPEHNFEVGFGGWGADYDDPYGYVEIFKSDSPYNYSNFMNKELDEILAATQAETDTDKRMDMLKEAEQLILDDGAFVPLQARNIFYMLDEDTTGIHFYYSNLNIDWVYADVAQ